jgi:hypothetical protein
MSLSKQEQDYICKLVQNANNLTVGEMIGDVLSLHKWSQVSSGFDSRFLANIFNCKVELAPYSDESLNIRLASWISWYMKQEKLDPSIFKKSNLSEFADKNQIPMVDINNVNPQKLTTSSKDISNSRSQICRTCDGFGVGKKSNLKCSKCNGSGWMSYSDYKEIINNLDSEIIKKSINEKFKEENKKVIEENKNWNKSKTICPNCGGDGGAAGQCYKCQGTGWVVTK